VDKTCGATEVCVGGACVDKCMGAICPHGQECKAGACVDLPKADGGVIFVPNYDAGLSGAAGTGGLGTGSAGSTSSTGSAGSSGQKVSPSNGCRCDAGPGAPGAGWLTLLACAFLLARRRSRA